MQCNTGGEILYECAFVKEHLYSILCGINECIDCIAVQKEDEIYFESHNSSRDNFFASILDIQSKKNQ